MEALERKLSKEYLKFSSSSSNQLVFLSSREFRFRKLCPFLDLTSAHLSFFNARSFNLDEIDEIFKMIQKNSNQFSMFRFFLKKKLITKIVVKAMISTSFIMNEGLDLIGLNNRNQNSS